MAAELLGFRVIDAFAVACLIWKQPELGEKILFAPPSLACASCDNDGRSSWPAILRFAPLPVMTADDTRGGAFVAGLGWHSRNTVLLGLSFLAAPYMS